MAAVSRCLILTCVAVIFQSADPVPDVHWCLRWFDRRRRQGFQTADHVQVAAAQFPYEYASIGSAHDPHQQACRG